MRPVGGLLTAMAIALLGFITSGALNRRQAIETNTRLYSELMSRREESESALRKDMCVSIITSFVDPSDNSLDADVLNLEMLAYNFHESLNLKPLFLEIRRRILRASAASTSPEMAAQNADYLDRIERVGREIVRRQMIVLEGVGRKVDRTIDLTADPEGTTLEPATLLLDGIETSFSIDVLGVDRVNREIRLGLSIETPDPELGRQTKMAAFSVSYFDFPMIDNTRLSYGVRCAVTLSAFAKDVAADLTTVCFPGEYASLKDRPYYDEVIQKLREANADNEITEP